MLDAYSVILHLDLNEAISSFILEKLTYDFYLAALTSKLKGVALQIEQYLLHTLFIGAQDVLVVWEIFKSGSQLNIHKICFLLLNHHDLLDRVLDVKVTQILSKLATIDLGKSQEIIYRMIEEFGRALLNLIALF